MDSEINKIVFLNQMAGPLFRELAEDLSDCFEGVSLLNTGHPDTIKCGSSNEKLLIVEAPEYDRRTYITRMYSWVKYTLFVAFSLFKLDANTALFIVSNPPLLGPLAWVINKLKGTPYIVLVYDLHPDTLIRFGALKDNTFLIRLWRAVNRTVWNSSCGVFTIGPVMARNIENQFEPDKTVLGKVGVVPPWADTGMIKPIDKRENKLTKEFGQEGKITILYSGNMGVSHDIDSILEAAKLLRDEKGIAFLMIGEGAKWQCAFDFQIENKLDNLQVLPFQPQENLPLTMPLADIALVALDRGAEGLMIPSKMFYYMAAGAAVIGICSGVNDVSAILRENECGEIVDPSSPELLARAISELAYDKARLEKYKVAARQSAMDKYSRHACMMNLSGQVSSILHV